MLTFHEIEGYIDQKRNELLQAISQFREDELHLTEHDGGWTVPEIIEHLVLVESFVVEQIDDIIRRLPDEPSESIDEKAVDVVVLFKAKGVIGRKTVASENLIPTGRVKLSESLEKLASVRDKLKSYLPHLERRATNLVTAHFDILGIDMNACQWVHFSSIHERAHINQINRIRQTTLNQERN